MARAAAAAAAAAATTPKITRSVLQDSNLDAHVDRVVLIYNVKVKHTADADGHYPFVVKGYTITKVAAAVSSTSGMGENGGISAPNAPIAIADGNDGQPGQNGSSGDCNAVC